MSTPNEPNRASEERNPTAVDILAEAPGQCLFKTAADVEAHLRDEREAWEN